MRAIFERKDLLRYIVVSKLKVSQKEMMLGYLWWIIDPILLMFVYWLLVRVIFKRGTENYPLFLICALVPWRAFSTSLSQAVTSISDKFGLISAVSFPRVLLPLADVIANHIKLLFGLLVVIGLAFFYDTPLNYRLIYLLIPFIFQFLIACGLSLILAVGGVYFRDLKNLIQFIVRVWLYLTPVLYPIERIPQELYAVFLANPMTCTIVLYRRIIMGGVGPEWRLGLVLLVETITLLTVGYVIFVISEKRILKLI